MMTEIVADGLHLASAKKAEDVWMRPCSLDGRLDTRLNLCGHHVKKQKKKQTNKQTQKLFVKISKEFPFSKRIGHQRRGPFIHPPFIIELDVHISLSMTTDKETLGIEESH